MTDYIAIPFPKQLYHDLVRWSDGSFDPTEKCVWALLWWLETTAESGDDNGFLKDDFGDNVHEMISTLFPSLVPHGNDTSGNERRLSIPLVWKGVTVPEGSAVRMEYAGRVYTAEVVAGKIRDADGLYSPSEWASKVASWTSRNAWRDLWFKMPGSSAWVLAMTLRSKIKEGSQP
jgi:hypothetical protein